MTQFQVKIFEIEKGVGHHLVETKPFETYDEAEAFVDEFNAVDRTKDEVYKYAEFH